MIDGPVLANYAAGEILKIVAIVGVLAFCAGAALGLAVFL